MTHDSGYINSDNNMETESDRLGLLESSRDPGTMRQLEELGVGPGWRCLEVGAGRGSIARWLAEQVSPGGSVTAADIDLRFLTDMPEDVEVRALDIREDEIEAEAYDLVHCRALLMHLPDPAETLTKLSAALKPGGLLLAEEPDFGLFHYGGHPDSLEMSEIAHRTFDTMKEAGIFDAQFGRSLPALLSGCGLSLLGTRIDTPVSGPGEPEYELARATTLESAPKLAAAGILTDANVTRLEDYFGQPGTFLTCSSLVAAWGRKPK